MLGSARAEGAQGPRSGPEKARTRARIGYLGPQGTFSEEALLAGVLAEAIDPVAFETFQDTILALSENAIEWAILPIENSLEGSVTVILDLLVDNAATLTIAGEELLPVKHFLIASDQLPLGEITRVLTHPQVPGQCRRFLRERLPHAKVLPASSTADAVRIAAAAPAAEGTAAIGTRLAAEIYKGVVLCENIEDRDDNITRFVWIAGAAATGPPPLRRSRLSGPLKTSLVFWGAGADSAGWLVRCLDEFARRQINLTKIESRPQGGPLGHYMFFVDLEGDASAQPAAGAIAGLAQLCEEVIVLGCYPAAGSPRPGLRP